MFSQKINAPSFLIPFAAIGIAATLVVPSAAIDAVIISFLFLLFGHILLQEKLLLVFLALRPALDYWRDTQVFSIERVPINLNAVFSGVVAGWSLFILVRHRTELRRIPGMPLGAALLLLMAASVVWSVAANDTILETAKWLNALSLFAVAAIARRKNILTKKELLAALLLSAIIPIAAAMLQLLSGAGMDTIAVRGRIYGTLAHPNVFAFLLLAVIMLLLQTAWSKKLKAAGIASLLLLILFTYTRAAMIGAVIFFASKTFFDNRRGLMRRLMGAALAVLVAYPIFALIITRVPFHAAQVPILSRILVRNEDADSLAWRQSLVRESIPIIAARPLLGYGFGAFTAVWEENRPLTHIWDDSAEAHNDYLRLALELGLVGFALYGAFLGRLLYASRKNPHLFAWIFMFIVVSLSENMLHHTPVLWLTFAWWGAQFGEMNNKKTLPA